MNIWMNITVKSSARRAELYKYNSLTSSTIPNQVKVNGEVAIKELLAGELHEAAWLHRPLAGLRQAIPHFPQSQLEAALVIHDSQHRQALPRAIHQHLQYPSSPPQTYHSSPPPASPPPPIPPTSSRWIQPASRTTSGCRRTPSEQQFVLSNVMFAL